MMETVSFAVYFKISLWKYYSSCIKYFQMQLKTMMDIHDIQLWKYKTYKNEYTRHTIMDIHDIKLWIYKTYENGYTIHTIMVHGYTRHARMEVKYKTYNYGHTRRKKIGMQDMQLSGSTRHIVIETQKFKDEYPRYTIMDVQEWIYKA